MKTGEGTYSSSLKSESLIQKVKRLARKTGSLLISSNFIIEIICALLIFLFIYTGVNKIRDIEKFRFEMGRSPFIQHYASVISYSIPIGELLLALGLILKKTRLLSLYLSLILMSLFAGYIWLMLKYAYDLPCSCGGIISELTWEEHLVFNVTFVVLTSTAIILQEKTTHKIKSTSAKQKLE